MEEKLTAVIIEQTLVIESPHFNEKVIEKFVSGKNGKKISNNSVTQFYDVIHRYPSCVLIFPLAVSNRVLNFKIRTRCTAS